MTEYLESSSCRRAVLAKHLDGHVEGTDCVTTDSILCDRCQSSLKQGSGSQDEDCVEGEGEGACSGGSGSGRPNSTEAIHEALKLQVGRNEQLGRFHQLLHAHCIYCQLMREEGEEYSHCHGDCPHAGSRNCDVQAYRRWRSRLKLAPRDQCFRCGLSQSVCKAIEDQTGCTYSHLMLPGLFFLHQVGQLLAICQEVGFRGEEEWQWQWMNRQGEGAFGQQEINWMRVWRRVGEIYVEIIDSVSSC